MKKNKPKFFGVDGVAHTGIRRVGFAYRNNELVNRRQEMYGFVERSISNKEGAYKDSLQTVEVRKKQGLRIGANTEVESLFRESQKKTMSLPEFSRVSESPVHESKSDYQEKETSLVDDVDYSEMNRDVFIKPSDVIEEERVEVSLSNEVSLCNKRSKEKISRVEESLVHTRPDIISSDSNNSLILSHSDVLHKQHSNPFQEESIPTQPDHDTEVISPRILSSEERKGISSQSSREYANFSFQSPAFDQKAVRSYTNAGLKREKNRRYSWQGEEGEQIQEYGERDLFQKHSERKTAKSFFRKGLTREDEVRELWKEREEVPWRNADNRVVAIQHSPVVTPVLRPTEDKRTLFTSIEKAPFTFQRTYTPSRRRRRTSFSLLRKKKKKDISLWTWSDWKQRITQSFRPTLSFARVAVVTCAILAMGSFVLRGMALHGYVLGVSTGAMDMTAIAIEKLRAFDFQHSEKYFSTASDRFHEASSELNDWAGFMRRIDSSIPVVSKISSGSNALEVATELTLSGKEMSLAASVLMAIGDPFASQDVEDTSLLDALREFSQHVTMAHAHLGQAEEYVNKVRVDHIPQSQQQTFLDIKTALPVARSLVGEYVENIEVFEDMLGANGPRKYLFLFQNPHEARATGGFIGSYGFLSMKNGHIDDFFVDGIFNPDGQLSVDIIPPEPIKKISAGWSLHDSNWFADFPLSAEKAMYFYEKGGGPTVDGVIAITPEVLRQLLELTGPIELPEYEAVVDAKNFMETLQYEVEVDYDKEENRPKQILDDLAPILIERVFSNTRGVGASDILEVVYRSLAQKHILLYSRDEHVQSLYERAGWTGSLLETSYDYLSVVHSNVNGYKTDGVIEESIHQESEIRDDGHVVNTVTIERRHTGGDTPYEWYNAVNADYMRVYVPLGSELVSVEGHTRETVEDPLDYEALGFLEDREVSAIEKTVRVHESSGTQIFEESGKTVFGNWIYVSPKESVKVTYTYVLPFLVSPFNEGYPRSFSFLGQKQSGSSGKTFSYHLQYPDSWKILYKTGGGEVRENREFFWEGALETDYFFGILFE